MQRTIAMLSLSLALACGAAAAADRPAGAPPVLLAVADDPTITFGVWFKVGSQDDPPGKAGLAYLTGQMLAAASTTKHPYEEILASLYPLASSYEVRVDKEMTTFGGRTHRDNVEKFYPLLADALLEPAFKPEDFERLRSDQLNYLTKSLRYSADEELGKAALYAFVFQGTGYQNPPEGTVEGLQSITLEDVKTFYKSHFTRDDAVVALGGGYDPKLLARFQATVATLPAGKPGPAPDPHPAPIQGREVLLVAKEGADASISLGFPLDVHRGEKDFYALWIANSWLGEHRNSASHLYQVIREARGLNYGDYSYIEIFPEGGRRRQPPANVGRRQQLFEVWVRTLKNDQAVFALRAALREVQDLVDHGMTPEEFALTREFLSKYSLHFAETTAERLGYAVDDRFYGLSFSHLQRFRQAMQELTVDDVNRAIRAHWQTQNLKIAIVTGAAEKLQAALVSGDPTPITYASEKPAAVTSEDAAIASFPLGITAEKIRIVPVEAMFQK